MVTGALPGPGGQASGRGEAAHVGADLRKENLSGALGYPGDGHGQPDASRERDRRRLDGVRQAFDLLVQEVQMGKDGSDKKGVVGLQWVFQFTAAAYNLVRMRTLLAKSVTG
jgi:hypothetical protein